MKKYKIIFLTGQKATTSFSQKAIAKIATKCAKASSAVGRTVFLLKRGKMIPGIGSGIALLFLPSDIYNKGWANGIANTTLDAIPVFGTGKGFTEFIFGDFIPDLDEYDPEIYDAIPRLPNP